MRPITGVIVLVMVFLAGCGSDDAPAPRATPTVQMPSGAATLSPALVRLQRRYEELVAAHQAITDVWETLADGGQVQCGQVPTSPAPESISAEGDSTYDPLVSVLRRAAIDVQQAVNLWEAECRQPRPIPSPDVIHEGLLAARSAGAALREAEGMLTGIQ